MSRIRVFQDEYLCFVRGSLMFAPQVGPSEPVWALCESPDQIFVCSTVVRLIYLLIDWFIESKICYFCILSLRNMASSSFRVCKLIVSRYSCKMSPLGLSLGAIARCCLLGWHQNSLSLTLTLSLSLTHTHTHTHTYTHIASCTRRDVSWLCMWQLIMSVVSVNEEFWGEVCTSLSLVCWPQRLCIWSEPLLLSTTQNSSACHVSTYPVPAVVVRYNKVLPLNHSPSVHPVINDPGSCMGTVFLCCMCSLMRVL
jgi:hypothetical protein